MHGIEAKKLIIECKKIIDIGFWLARNRMRPVFTEILLTIDRKNKIINNFQKSIDFFLKKISKVMETISFRLITKID